MVQQWQAATGYTLQEMGIAPWVTKAQQQAQKVLQLVTVRVDNESAKVKGELAAARKQTDEAIRKAYDILNALAVLQPTQELNALGELANSYMTPMPPAVSHDSCWQAAAMPRSAAPAAPLSASHWWQTTSIRAAT